MFSMWTHKISFTGSFFIYTLKFMTPKVNMNFQFQITP